MKRLRQTFSFVAAILKTILYDWVFRLAELCRNLRERCLIWKRRRRLPVRLRRTAKQPCVPISDPAFKRPDPMIYA